MANIEIYTKATCPYCHRAKALITRKGVPFQEIPIDGDVDLREEMIKRSGRTPRCRKSLSMASMWAGVTTCMRSMRAAAFK